MGHTAVAGSPAAPGTFQAAPPDFHEVDIGSLQRTQRRSAGVERVGVQVLGQLGCVDELTELDLNRVQRAAILGNVIGRMAAAGPQARGDKSCDKITEPIGKLEAKSRGNSQHCVVTPTLDETGKTVVALSWQKTPVPGTMATDPGVHRLRRNEPGWDEETLWRTCTMHTDLESVFRSLKSELGLRPTCHSKELRCHGQLFITVLACQCVQSSALGLSAVPGGTRKLVSRARKKIKIHERQNVAVRQRLVRKQLGYLAAGLGCDARREVRRVASHTSDTQRRSAPKTSESNVRVVLERALTP